MESRTRCRAAQEVANPCPTTSISDLPEGLLERVLGFVSCLKERQLVALVSKRFAAAACSPELLQRVDAGHVQGAVAVRSLEAWLARHGGHVRQLQLTASPLSRQDAAEVIATQTALTECLEAAAAAGQLVRLSAGSCVTSTAWLGGMPSLQQLELFGETWVSPLHLSPAISGLTALRSLSLDGHIVTEDGLQLPASITWLRLSDYRSQHMPGQVTQLHRLAELELECTYSADSMAPIAQLAGSLTRLCVLEGTLPPILHELTRLRELHLERCESELDLGSTINAALPHLTELTCLVLGGELLELPNTLASLPQLQRCYLDLDGSPPLPPGPWLASLRWLAASVHSIIRSTAVLSAAFNLELVEVMGNSDFDWSSRAAAGLFDWLAQHPPLRRVCLNSSCWEYAADHRCFEAGVAQLRSRRPGLQAHWRAALDAEGDSLFLQLLEEERS